VLPYARLVRRRGRAAGASRRNPAVRLRGRDRAGDRQGGAQNRKGKGARAHRRVRAMQRRDRARVDAARQIQRHAGQELRRFRKPLHLITKVNGEIRQDDTTANLIFSFADLLAYITIFTTLKPGDIIVTGTPVGAGARFDPPRWLKAGDVVEVSVPEIGTLSNRVVDES